MIGSLPLSEPINDEDVRWACELMNLKPLDSPRKDFLKSLSTIDVSACPGSGKTTLVVAKLAMMARKWRSNTSGICVLSHTNVAREEIERRLGYTDVGQVLLRYPHFIGTIHGLVARFLALPRLQSEGCPFSAIDDDITVRVRRSALKPKEYQKLNSYLKQKHQSFDNLRLGGDNTVRLWDQRTNKTVDFPAGSATDSYMNAHKALLYAQSRGYLCYDEVFVLGEALLVQQPDLPSILSQRFPFVLIDEMQDTSEQQSSFLRRIFPRDSNNARVQRVGDPNQAIFSGVQPDTDVFPDTACCCNIANSFRFDASIARLANPLALLPVQPNGLEGVVATNVHGQGLPHTIFVFSNHDATKVLDAFGRHVLATLPQDLLGTAPVAAIGAVHRPHFDVDPNHPHYPKTVAHYWAEYHSDISKSSYQPNTLAECVLVAQCNARRGGQINECVNSIALGITHLANLTGTTRVRVHARQHRHLENQLVVANDAQAVYRGVLTRFLIDGEPITKKGWLEVCPSLKMLATALGGGDHNSQAASEFLAWPDAVHLPQNLEQNNAPPNVYRYSDGQGKIDIRLSSIHQAKGQTHLATLVLETFQNSHVLHGLMNWLLGKRQNGAECGPQNSKHLLLSYVAMTRATHLLCLALRKASLGSGPDYEANRQKLAENGWRIQDVTPPCNGA